MNVFTKPEEVPEEWRCEEVVDGHFIQAFLSILSLPHDSPAMVARAHSDQGDRFIVLQSTAGVYKLDPIRAELIADALENTGPDMCPRCHVFHLECATGLRTMAKSYRESLN